MVPDPEALLTLILRPGESHLRNSTPRCSLGSPPLASAAKKSSLTNDDGYFVGVCWGTSDYSGNGNGYFTDLKILREFNEENGFGWLNDIGHSLAREIPIIDRNNPQGRYSKDYIPLPGGR